VPHRLDPAVAAVRHAVRSALHDVEPSQLVLVACSGGADSMALAAALAFTAPRVDLRAGAVVVDHGLQQSSDAVARQVAEHLRSLGLSPVEVVAAQVSAAGRGPEAAAREARYAALAATAARLDAAVVLLGHTRDDQAETVLLGLARGSGARSLAGMRAVSGKWRRPLLDLPRERTVAACRAETLPVWDDPHNADLGFTRARVRHRVLPLLERELGPGVGPALARTAELLTRDADALDSWAQTAADECAGAAGLLATALQQLPVAVRTRVLRGAALAAGSPATDLAAGHIEAVDALVMRWHGQRGVDLPGGVRAVRSSGEVRFETGAVGG
jgi:tRNA(Ile)-lysidine synthase